MYEVCSLGLGERVGFLRPVKNLHEVYKILMETFVRKEAVQLYLTNAKKVKKPR